MGLDMNLVGQPYIAGDARDKYQDAILDALSLVGSKYAVVKEKNLEYCYNTVKVELAYWRKANAIHSWFVRNVQQGNDDCGRYLVDTKELVTLRDLCEDILQRQDRDYAVKHLSPQEGFFFGSTDIDEYYWGDLSDTINQIDAILEMIKTDEENKVYWDVYYQSSW